jgi:beta-glucosidase
MLALYGLLLAPFVLAQGGALQGAGTGSGPVAGSGGGAGGGASSASPAPSDSASAAAETGAGTGTAASASSSTSTTPTSTTPAPTYTATDVVFNSTGASLYSSTTLYTPPASSTTNIFSIVPSGYTNPKAAAPLQNRTNEYNSPAWQAAYSKARPYLSSWSLEEKVQLTTGAGWQIGRCLGNIPAVPNQGFPGLCIQDSPLGVRLADFVSAFPAGINVATTWDKDLMYARGYAMGEEFKGKGANVALGPATNIARAPVAGRNWEGFGADPYLAGWAVEQTVKGLQDAGVQATYVSYLFDTSKWFSRFLYYCTC